MKPFLLLILPFLVLTGCIFSPPHTNGQNTELEYWLSTELNPYLRQQLQQHPHFKGKSVLLVKFNEQDISPEIDQFSKQIRQRLFDTLMQTVGVNLYWRPNHKTWQHHRSLADLQCQGLQDLAVYLGLDVQQLPDQQSRISIRALDKQAGQWISGFGKSWQGTLSQEQQQALQHISADAYLRGLRPLPFETQQVDLNAAYLAQNIACLLQQSGQSEHRLYFQPNASQGYFHNVQGLIVNYISQFKEVQVSDEKQAATVTISQDIKHIHDDLYQYWLIPRWKDQAVRLSGTATSSYAKLPQTMVLNSVKPLAPKPQVPAHRTTDIADTLINDFNLVVPPVSSDCQGLVYWDNGMQALSNGAQLPSGGCYGLSLILSRSAHVVLIQQESQGHWIRLYPNQCRGMSLKAPLSAWKTVRFPSGNKQLTHSYKLDQHTGNERFYVFATQQNSTQLSHYANQIPDICSPLVNSTYVSGKKLLNWANQQQDVHWRSVFIQHIQPSNG